MRRLNVSKSTGTGLTIIQLEEVTAHDHDRHLYQATRWYLASTCVVGVLVPDGVQGAGEWQRAIMVRTYETQITLHGDRLHQPTTILTLRMFQRRESLVRHREHTLGRGGRGRNTGCLQCERIALEYVQCK